MRARERAAARLAGCAVGGLVLSCAGMVADFFCQPVSPIADQSAAGIVWLPAAAPVVVTVLFLAIIWVWIIYRWIDWDDAKFGGWRERRNHRRLTFGVLALLIVLLGISTAVLP